jgi:hemerythrin-like domain-containing protein
MDQNRRSLLRDSLVMGVAIGAASTPVIGETLQKSPNAGEKEGKEPEVTATEDLMREHGVIRRALLVYIETAPKLRQNASSVDAAALRQVAQLFRTFGEDYHERMLEEQHIFPVIQKPGGELKRYAEILTDQHNRGREITDYVLAVTNGSKISTAHAEPLANRG